LIDHIQGKGRHRSKKPTQPNVSNCAVKPRENHLAEPLVGKHGLAKRDKREKVGSRDRPSIDHDLAHLEVPPQVRVSWAKKVHADRPRDYGGEKKSLVTKSRGNVFFVRHTSGGTERGRAAALKATYCKQAVRVTAPLACTAVPTTIQVRL
jgi:hypothetical protein